MSNFGVDRRASGRGSWSQAGSDRVGYSLSGRKGLEGSGGTSFLFLFLFLDFFLRLVSTGSKNSSIEG